MAQDRLDSIREVVTRARGQRDYLRTCVSDTQKQIKNLDNLVEQLDLCSAVIRSMIDKEIMDGVQAIESLQTEGLRVVFHDQKIKVRTEVDIQHGKVSVAVVTSQERTDGVVIEGDSTKGFGGAVVTVQSILLRLAIILRRKMRLVMFLDETLPAFDGKYVHNMGKFLKVLCERTGVDILLVTHNTSLVDAADIAYKIKSDGTTSSFQRIV